MHSDPPSMSTMTELVDALRPQESRLSAEQRSRIVSKIVRLMAELDVAKRDVTAEGQVCRQQIQRRLRRHGVALWLDVADED